MIKVHYQIQKVHDGVFDQSDDFSNVHFSFQ